MLISGKAQDFGKDSSKLSDSVTDHFAKMFSMAVSENKDEPNNLKASFQASLREFTNRMVSVSHRPIKLPT